MRSKRFSLIILLGVALTWSGVTYIMYLAQPNHADRQPKRISNSDLDSGINKLENYISNMYESNNNMLVKAQDTLDAYERHLIEQNRAFKDNDKLVKHKKRINGQAVIPVLVIACNRVTVTRCIDLLLKYRPDPKRFPIIVSQDCSDTRTRDAILSYDDRVTLIEQPDQNDIAVPSKEKKFKGYFKISRHYGWALNQTFFTYGFEATIVVEDDLEVSSDFFEYFLGTYPLLERDPTLWCVSAWNDNGKAGLINEENAERLYRTDFFPGLGWLLRRDLWRELAPKWPRAYWDDWIRKPEQRKNRACIRPEVSRTKTFGKIGVSNGMYYEKHLKFIKLNQRYVPFTRLDLTYLLKDNYDKQFVKNDVYDSPEITFNDVRGMGVRLDDDTQTSRRLTYRTREAYRKYAKLLGLMDDFRSGVPRTGYRGIVTFYAKTRYVHLAPPQNWIGYDVT